LEAKVIVNIIDTAFLFRNTIWSCSNKLHEEELG
jgi:hypothetical protein